MLDRTRVHKEVHEVDAEHAQLSSANNAERHRVDEVFNQRQSAESQVCLLYTSPSPRD